MKLTDKTISVQKLTSKEFNRMYQDAIQLYKDAVWQLADIIALGTEKFGRENLLEITDLDRSKIRWLCTIAGITKRNSTLPECHYEVSGLDNRSYWLRIARSENLKPSELRKRIRKSQKHFNKEKNINAPAYSKYTLLLQNDLRKLGTIERQQAIEYIQRNINERMDTTTCSNV